MRALLEPMMCCITDNHVSSCFSCECAGLKVLIIFITCWDTSSWLIISGKNDIGSWIKPNLQIQMPIGFSTKRTVNPAWWVAFNEIVCQCEGVIAQQNEWQPCLPIRQFCRFRDSKCSIWKCSPEICVIDYTATWYSCVHSYINHDELSGDCPLDNNSDTIVVVVKRYSIKEYLYCNMFTINCPQTVWNI